MALRRVMIWYGGRHSDRQLAGEWRPGSMTEGPGRTAASAPRGAGARDAAVPDGKPAAGAGDLPDSAPPAEPPATPDAAAARAVAKGSKVQAAKAAARAAGARPGKPAARQAGAHRRVDARRLESVLLEGRHSILDA